MEIPLLDHSNNSVTTSLFGLGARVLNGPYEGTPTGSPSARKFDGFGFGANRDSMAGVPHFEEVTFIGRFPVAELEFHNANFPGQVRMTALSPFIPHNDRDSSMPVALFAFSVENDTAAAIDYTIASTLGNYGCDSGIHTFARKDSLSILQGREGQHIREGSCEGSCTHVWNYQQALANLFPTLERTLRETEFTYNQLPSGGLTFRQRLPLGSGFDIIGPCTDGHFGAIVKAYREWKNLGDDRWLRRYWPNIKRAIEYAWSADNPDKWDPDKTGVLWGRQHHTLDMELFGPNSWLTTMNLAALTATSIMADAMNDPALANEYRDIWPGIRAQGL